MAVSGLDAGFWEGLEQDELRLPRCKDCQAWIWPAEPRCKTCGSFALRWDPVALEGIVYSWTRTWYPFVDERAADLPYVVVLVELPHAGGSRLLGVLTGDEAGLRTGARVVGRIAPASDRTFGLRSVTWSVRP